jgi:hypothetical protein
MRDYLEWHRQYDDPTSGLSGRLVLIRRHLRDLLDAAPAPVSVRVLSLCAGDGRDVITTLAARPPGSGPVEATLVELHPVLAARAAGAAASAGLASVEVRTGDAGSPATFADRLPVEVLLLVGVLGNIDPHTVGAVVDGLPALVVPGGHVIWSRGGPEAGEPDRREEVRAAFRSRGLLEVAWYGAPQGFGLGVNRFPDRPPLPAPPLPERLFTFDR